MDSLQSKVCVITARTIWLARAAVCILAMLFLLPVVSFAAVDTVDSIDSVSSQTRLISEEWMNILFQGQKIGFSYQKTEKVDTGYKITDRAVMRLKIMGISQDMSFSNVSNLNENKRPKDFVYLQTIQNQRQKTSGVLTGKTIELTITGAGGTSKQTVKVDPATRFADSLEFEYADKLKVGFKTTVPVFITSMRSVEPLTLEVVGRKEIEFDGDKVDVLVVNSSIQGVATVSYVTPEGITLREESFMGFASEKTTEDIALKFTEAHVPITSLITFSLITPDKPINNPRALTELNITMGGLNNPEIVPEDNRQSIGEAERVFDEARKKVIYRAGDPCAR